MCASHFLLLHMGTFPTSYPPPLRACGAMDYASPMRSTYGFAAWEMIGTWATRRTIIDCLSRPFTTDFELAVHGATYPSALDDENGPSAFSRWAKRGVF